MIIDRFAGPGGWDEGLRLLGRTDVVGIEWDTSACETARANGHLRVQGDVAAIDPHEFVAEHLGGEAPEGGVDSPPCQGFSMAGKGAGRADVPRIMAAVAMIGAGLDVNVVLANLRMQCIDPRSTLVLEPLRWALALRPQWLAWEQVPAVLPLWEACADVLRAHGYSAWTATLRAEQYGVPQTRKRACFGASRMRTVAPPPPTHSRYYERTPARLDDGVLPWVSMAKALGRGMVARPSMTVTGGGGSTGGAEPFALAARRGMAREIEAGRWRLGDVRSANGTVRDSDQPANHRVTIEEAALLQSFPAGYVWRGTKTARYQQVGNAVPPLLAAAVLHSVGAAS